MKSAVPFLLLAALLTPGCRGCSASTPFCGDFGCFLEDAPDPQVRRGPTLTASRPDAVERFVPRYRRVKTIEPGRGPARFSRSVLHAARPRVGARFSWPCPKAAAHLQAWLFTQSSWRGGAPLELAVGSKHVRLDLPQRPNQLVRMTVSLPAKCDDVGRMSVEIVGAPKTPTPVLMTLPRLVAAAIAASPPVILISVDTLRADFWDDRDDRPASLQSFWSEAIRFTRAYAPTGTTHPSHRVMLSGRLLGDTWSQPIDESVALAAALRARGYDTAAFSGGGYMRASFGFGMGLPPAQRGVLGGFAIGFDLYHERLEVEGVDRARADKKGHAFDLDLARSTYTLGVSLERSLRAIFEHPSLSFFHLVHGYDVHDARDVAREFFVAARRAADLGDTAELDACIEQVGLHGDDNYVVHFSQLDRIRDNKLGELTDCHRRLAAIMYDARVRSVEAMLATYFDMLRTIGVYERALIVVTSDHGESLLDEERREHRLHWGHNELLETNLRVPLWIKLPGATRGRDDDRTAGLIDLRATIAGALGLDLGVTAGIDLLALEHERLVPLELDQFDKEAGVILADRTLCVWRRSKSPGLALHDLRVHAGGWRAPDQETAARCRAARDRVEASGAAAPTEPPAMSDAEREELRTLGYVK